MTFAAGTRIGPYEIGGSLGAGGMGEVYRARDTHLNRSVAIKVLPAFFAGDPDRLARFEREAQTLAALNHPHIAQIYGMVELPPEGGGHANEGASGSDANVGTAGSRKALVMELVEGDDLAHVIARGAVPAEEAMRIAGQIAEALEEAHERGIVHRDLKPANIKIRPDGTVKVLDFGLAKALTPIGSPAGSHSTGGIAQGFGPAQSPTLTSPALVPGTELGMILGTAAYMAPEQAKGKTVDTRADIWAFGVILFEMLAGRPMFAYESIAETIGAVVHRDVPWEALRPDTPPHLRFLLQRCLQKDPKQRLRDIGDARLLLDAGIAFSTSPSVQDGLARGWRPWVSAGVAAAALMVAVWVWTAREAAPQEVPVVRFAVHSPAAGVPITLPVLPVDGSFVLYRADRLYVRSLAEITPRPLAGTEDAWWPFLSPDGKWVGFYAEGKIKKVGIGGGDPIVVTAVDADTPGAAWGYGNRIYFSPAWNGSALWSVSADSDTPVRVSTLDTEAAERGHWWPHALPDGRHLLFTIWYASAGLSEAKIGVLDLETGKHRVLFPGARPQYAAGHLLYYRAGGYHLAPFDPTSMVMTGESRAVLTDAPALEPQGTSTMPLALAANGTIAYKSGTLSPELRMTWITHEGREEAAPVTMRVHGSLDLSPDGHRVAIGRLQGGTTQIWVGDLQTGSEQRLSAAGLNYAPVWHPEGQEVAFISMRRGDFDIYLQRLDGSAEEALESSELDESPEAWFPSGRKLIVKNWLADGSTTIFLLDLDRRTRTPLVTGAFHKGPVRVSPNGRWLAVVANPSGRWQVLLRKLDGTSGVSVVPGDDIFWETAVRWGTGDRLYFIRRSELVMAKVLERDGRLSVVHQETIARLPAGSVLGGISPDGQRVLVGKPVGTETADEAAIHVIVNGVQALTR